jgi:osmotically-inducible protein OsmY
MLSFLEDKKRNKQMKTGRTIALASAVILAAGCAHEEHHAQYDESLAPNASQSSSQYNSNQFRSDQNGTAAATPSEPNDVLVNRVRQSLQQDPKVAPAVPNIQITADKGMVVLSGTVQTREQKRQIQSIVAGDWGVDILDDQLRVSSGAMNPTSRPDTGSSIYQNGSGKTGDPPGSQPANPTVNGGDNSVNTVAPSDLNKSKNNDVRLLSPTSNNTNSSPRIYHDAGSMNSSSNNALNSTSRTNGQSQIYQDQNSPGLNTNGNNKIP